MTKTKINYDNTIIYKIVCNDLNIEDLYVGHTTGFINRKTQHKTVCNNQNASQYKIKLYEMIRENGGWENWSMVEIEKYPCSDGNEARARERYWFETLNAKLNTCVPNRGLKESGKNYRDKNKDKLNEKRKKYVAEHQEQIIEYRKNHKERAKVIGKLYEEKNRGKRYADGKVIFNCECGSSICIGKLASHKCSIKHQEFIKNQINI